jgi:RNA polymerase sigma-70 factor (ECF subfamily)
MDTTPGSLLERLRVSNENAAWERFVRLFTPMIYRVAKGAGLRHDDACEVVQDVFLLLARKMPEFQYDRTKSFRGWLRTVTLNKLREHARRRQLTSQQGNDANLSQFADESELNLLEEAEYHQSLAARAMELMRAEFSPTTWQACWEHVVSGRTAAAIAEELGISESAVYVAKCRVLQRLRTELAGLLD